MTRMVCRQRERVSMVDNLVWFQYKQHLSSYGDSHYKDKMVIRQGGISSDNKKSSIYMY